MPSLQGLGQRVRHVLRDIHIHLQVNSAGEPVLPTSSASSSPPATPVEGDELPVPVSTSVPADTTEVLPWWERRTTSAPSPAVLALAGNIGPAGELSAEDRISLAYLRGRQAAEIRRGTLPHFVGERCTLKNRCYVVLRGGVIDEPFFTWSFPVHQRAVRTDPDGGFSRRAISHGFPSQTEATAFCLGAGLDSLAPSA